MAGLTLASLSRSQWHQALTASSASSASAASAAASSDVVANLTTVRLANCRANHLSADLFIYLLLASVECALSRQ